jgi:hypothetical protein
MESIYGICQAAVTLHLLSGGVVIILPEASFSEISPDIQ